MNWFEYGRWRLRSINCENSLPQGPQSVLRGPADNLPVDGTLGRLLDVEVQMVEQC